MQNTEYPVGFHAADELSRLTGLPFFDAEDSGIIGSAGGHFCQMTVLVVDAVP